MYKNILIATDGSDFANYAVNQGIELANSVGASATIVTVTELWSALEMAQKVKVGSVHPTEDYEVAASESAKHILESAEKIAIDHGVRNTTRKRQASC